MNEQQSALQRAEPMKVVGREVPRIDGAYKVSGVAKYASDHHLPSMFYAVPVGATIANGTVTAINAAIAEQMPGVRAVFRHGDLPPMHRVLADMAGLETVAYLDEHRPPLSDDAVRYYGQYVALVVADTFEQAKAAADAVRVSYNPGKPNVEPPRLSAKDAKTKSERGDADAGFRSSPVTIDKTYTIAPETHNPIETHATVAVWNDDELTLYETSQGVVNHRNVVADMLGLPREKVRVISRFLGSGFGSKLWPWTQSPLAAAAARKLGQPVKLVLSRQMMFHAAGHRPRTEQRVRLGANSDGTLISLHHDYINATSMLDSYEENCGEATPHMYSVPNLRVTADQARRHIGTPTSMRGPGAVPGLFATESAIDELAIKLGMDPIALRLANEPDGDEGLDIAFSSRHFQECLKEGAERFGWSQRDPAIGSMRRDGLTLGWGVAACSWIAERFGCTVSVDLRADGTVRVASAVQDIGTGTYTVMAQMAAEHLGIPLERVEVALGDTDLPAGPVSGGSMATASLVAPIHGAIADAGAALMRAVIAMGDASPFGRSKMDALTFLEGQIRHEDGHAMRFDDVLKALKVRAVSGRGSGQGTFLAPGKPDRSRHSFGAHFVEVAWQPEIARLRVSRVASVIDAGRILNPLTARNQIEGSIVMGVGMALLEATDYDPRNGAPINASLADYLVATHADTPEMDVHFIQYPDNNVNDLGLRGVGEIGLAGLAAAITNAVYHATGVRCRDLPIALEDLLS